MDDYQESAVEGLILTWLRNASLRGGSLSVQQVWDQTIAITDASTYHAETCVDIEAMRKQHKFRKQAISTQGASQAGYLPSLPSRPRQTFTFLTTQWATYICFDLDGTPMSRFSHAVRKRIWSKHQEWNIMKRRMRYAFELPEKPVRPMTAKFAEPDSAPPVDRERNALLFEPVFFDNDCGLSTLQTAHAALPSVPIPINGFHGTRMRTRLNDLPQELIQAIINPILDEAFEADVQFDDRELFRSRLKTHKKTLPMYRYSSTSVFLHYITAFFKLALLDSRIRAAVFSIIRSARDRW